MNGTQSIFHSIIKTKCSTEKKNNFKARERRVKTTNNKQRTKKTNDSSGVNRVAAFNVNRIGIRLSMRMQNIEANANAKGNKPQSIGTSNMHTNTMNCKSHWILYRYTRILRFVCCNRFDCDSINKTSSISFFMQNHSVLYAVRLPFLHLSLSPFFSHLIWPPIYTPICIAH